jgi:hypothetical protein
MFKLRLLITILSLAALNAYAAGPQQFAIQDFFPESKLIAIGMVIEGKAMLNKKTSDVCGVTFDVVLEEVVKGGKAGEIVKVHHITDDRFGSLEIGSHYFLYAEDRSTHELINLGDALDITLNKERPKECHSSTTNLYIYREFTHKINGSDGYVWIGEFDLDSWEGIQQITETRRLPRVYLGSHEGGYGYFLESREYGFQNDDKVQGGALALEPVMNLFKTEYAKSLNKSIQPTAKAAAD